MNTSRKENNQVINLATAFLRRVAARLASRNRPGGVERPIYMILYSQAKPVHLMQVLLYECMFRMYASNPIVIAIEH